MKKTIYPVLLGVYPRDVLLTDDLPALAAHLTDRFRSEVVCLNGGNALAVNYVPRPAQNRKEYFESVHNMERVSSEIPVDRSFRSLKLRPPHAGRYRVVVALPAQEEKSGKATFMMSERVCRWDALELAILFDKNRTEGCQKAEQVVTQWLREACSNGFGNERLTASCPSPVSISEGLLVPTPCAGPLTFPCLELYLRLRTALPLSQRPQVLKFQESKPGKAEGVTYAVNFSEHT